MRLIKQVFNFYYEGFKSMTIGKKLWTIILIKLAFMFLILKLFFFPDLLKTKFDNDDDRGNYVIEQIVHPVHNQ